MGKTQIMVVEDESIVAKDIEMSLHKLGYHVCSLASSGEEAIRKAEEDKPDLVLMDIVLQGEMSGVEAAGQIRYQIDIPVIYLTAYEDKETLNNAKITEPFGYMIKPFETSYLKSILDYVSLRKGGNG